MKARVQLLMLLAALADLQRAAPAILNHRARGIAFALQRVDPSEDAQRLGNEILATFPEPSDEEFNAELRKGRRA